MMQHYEGSAFQCLSFMLNEHNLFLKLLKSTDKLWICNGILAYEDNNMMSETFLKFKLISVCKLLNFDKPCLLQFVFWQWRRKG